MVKIRIKFFPNRFYSLNGLPFFFFDNAMQLIWFTNNVSRFSGIFFIDFQWREIAVISPSKFSIVTFQRKLGPSYKWVPSFKKKLPPPRKNQYSQTHNGLIITHWARFAQWTKLVSKTAIFYTLILNIIPTSQV